MKNLRLTVAEFAARSAGALSRAVLGKSGETISGRVVLGLYPNSIKLLSIEKTVLLVSGTNGKTSTTKSLAQIVSSLGKVASNTTGSNLNWGVANALMNRAPVAVLEVDELHLPNVISETNPKVVLLLNLTRDQLHRMHEVKRVADHWREACTQATDTTFVIDVDDPFLNYATQSAKQVIKVSFGGRRHPDGSVCPSCGKYLNWSGGIYSCGCGLTNKVADRTFPDGSAGYRNAILANVAGEIVGAKAIEVDEKALERTITKHVGGSTATIRLTKNPASWTEALRGVDSNNVVLILNARQVDGLDTSWLWDVSYASLKGKKVIVCGERGIDLSYRLHIEGVVNTLVDTFETAMRQFPSGSNVAVLAAYTAFFALASK
jgi:lipid II isoglutaminyl synthase (glutamine-hydrolysing)